MDKHDIKGTMNIVGEGEVKAKPDVAMIDLGVTTESKSAREAVAENAARMDKVVGRIKALNIPPDDIQTIGFSLSPVIDYTNGSPTYGKIIGYQVVDTVHVKVDPKRAGAVIDEAMAAGANNAGSLSFGLRNAGDQQRLAMERAMQAAMRDAELIASGMKVTILGINNVEVTRGGQPFYRGAMMTKSMDTTTPIEPGTVTISARATVSYAIAHRR